MHPQRSSKLDALTPTETQVLRMMGKGLSRTQIAETLHRSVKTIDTHRARDHEEAWTSTTEPSWQSLPFARGSLTLTDAASTRA